MSASAHISKECNSRNLFGVEIVQAIARDMLSEAISMEALSYCFNDNFFEGTGCMFAELARMRVMTMHRARG